MLQTVQYRLACGKRAASRYQSIYDVAMHCIAVHFKRMDSLESIMEMKVCKAVLVFTHLLCWTARTSSWLVT